MTERVGAYWYCPCARFSVWMNPERAAAVRMTCGLCGGDLGPVPESAEIAGAGRK